MQQKHLKQKRTQAELLPVHGLAGVLLRLGVQAQVSPGESGHFACSYSCSP